MVALSFEKKRKLQIYLLVTLVLVCVLTLTACNGDTSYNVEGNVTEPTHFMAKFMLTINKSIGGGAESFGWTVVVFTIILRLILSPLDIWQKLIARKNSKAMERMKPQLEVLQEKYSEDPQRLQQEQMALYKKEKYSMMGMCLPTIISFVVFFVVFAGFRQMVGYQFANDYKDCYNTFNTSISEQIEENYGDINNDGAFNVDDIPKTEDGAADYVAFVDKAQQAVYDAYYAGENTKVRGWLWIKNIFVGDNWSQAVPNFTTVTGQSGFATSRLSGITVDEYELVMGKTLKTGGWGKEGKWNGLLILPVLSIALSFLSTKLATVGQTDKKRSKADKKKEKDAANPQQSSMKAMQYVMPIMMGVFGLLYSGAFALYMFTSSLTAILFQLSFNLIGRLVDRSRANKTNPNIAKR